MEELEADWEPDFELIGLLNDDSNPVGAVHLGVVFSVQADGARRRRSRARQARRRLRRSPMSWPASWPRLETWSQLVADALGLGLEAPGSPSGHPTTAATDILDPCSVASLAAAGPGDRDRRPGGSRARPMASSVARLELTGVIDQVNAAYIEEALRVAADDGTPPRRSS